MLKRDFEQFSSAFDERINALEEQVAEKVLSPFDFRCFMYRVLQLLWIISCRRKIQKQFPKVDPQAWEAQYIHHCTAHNFLIIAKTLYSRQAVSAHARLLWDELLKKAKGTKLSFNITLESGETVLFDTQDLWFGDGGTKRAEILGPATGRRRKNNEKPRPLSELFHAGEAIDLAIKYAELAETGAKTLDVGDDIDEQQVKHRKSVRAAILLGDCYKLDCEIGLEDGATRHFPEKAVENYKNALQLLEKSILPAKETQELRENVTEKLIATYAEHLAKMRGALQFVETRDYQRSQIREALDLQRDLKASSRKPLADRELSEKRYRLGYMLVDEFFAFEDARIQLELEHESLDAIQREDGAALQQRGWTRWDFKRRLCEVKAAYARALMHGSAASSGDIAEAVGLLQSACKLANNLVQESLKLSPRTKCRAMFEEAVVLITRFDAEDEQSLLRHALKGTLGNYNEKEYLGHVKNSESLLRKAARLIVDHSIRDERLVDDVVSNLKVALGNIRDKTITDDDLRREADPIRRLLDYQKELSASTASSDADSVAIASATAPVVAPQNAKASAPVSAASSSGRSNRDAAAPVEVGTTLEGASLTVETNCKHVAKKGKFGSPGPATRAGLPAPANVAAPAPPGLSLEAQCREKYGKAMVLCGKLTAENAGEATKLLVEAADLILEGNITDTVFVGDVISLLKIATRRRYGDGDRDVTDDDLRGLGDPFPRLLSHFNALGQPPVKEEACDEGEDDDREGVGPRIRKRSGRRRRAVVEDEEEGRENAPPTAPNAREDGEDEGVVVKAKPRKRRVVADDDEEEERGGADGASRPPLAPLRA
eukprot:tig00000882_g5271.t1